MFLYLANDVIQNSKKKGPEYSVSFAPLLQKAFKHISHHCEDEKTFSSLKRILDVWEERGVYDKEMIKEWKDVLKHPKPKKSQTSSGKSKEESSSAKKRKVETPPASVAIESEKKKHKTTPSKAKILEVNGETHVTLSPAQPLSDPPEPEELIKMLESLENAASSDAATREKITKLPPEVSNISELSKIEDKDAALKLARKVNEAVELLKDYNIRLASEMTERNKVAIMLKDFQKEQQELLTQAEQRLDVRTNLKF